MKINIKLWSETPIEQLERLFLQNPYPLYRGTPIGNQLMKKYMFELAQESASLNNAKAIVVHKNGRPLATGQMYFIPYLIDFWKLPIGGLGHIVIDKEEGETIKQATGILIAELVKSARREGIAFLSANAPGPNITLAQALEKNGFLYAEGFINMVGTTNEFRDEFRVPELNIREVIEDDFQKIADAYSKVSFPSRFVADTGFDKKKALNLYERRFKEVYEQKLGKVFVAELENIFAGALIAIIDEKMEKAIGVKTNILSGMGIVIHPRAARKGVALALIEHRQDYYKSLGVDYVNFGANFNNLPMIRGLTKLGLQYGSLDMTYHQWL